MFIFLSKIKKLAVIVLVVSVLELDPSFTGSNQAESN
jgi:hypothetical protein